MGAHFDVVVVGAGVPGMLAALGFARQGRKVALLEARVRPPAGNDLLFALHHPACELLRGLGIWQLLAWPLKVRRMRVCAAGGGQLEVSAAGACLDSLCHMVEEDELLAVLARAVARAPVTVRCGAGVSSLRASGATVRVACGATEFTASLVVGADGAGSSVASLARLPGQPARLPYSSVVARLVLPHLGREAWQWMGPDGVLALLPGQAGRACLVWSVRHARARQLQALPAAAFMAELRRRCGAPLAAALAPASRHAVPLRDHLRQLSSGRVALVGDSAHGFHPLAGQGLSVGLGDVACLLRAQARRAPGCARALGEYRRLRTVRAQATLGLTRMLARMAEAPGTSLPVLGLATPLGGKLAWLANRP